MVPTSSSKRGKSKCQSQRVIVDWKISVRWTSLTRGRRFRRFEAYDYTATDPNCPYDYVTKESLPIKLGTWLSNQRRSKKCTSESISRRTSSSPKIRCGWNSTHRRYPLLPEAEDVTTSSVRLFTLGSLLKISSESNFAAWMYIKP